MDESIIKIDNIADIAQHPQLKGDENLIDLVKKRAESMQSFLIQASSVKVNNLTTQVEYNGKPYKICIHK